MSNSRETIHLSLGSTANSVTAHLVNLQGLAATSNNDAVDANITHAIHQQVHVPRIIMVDEPANCQRRVVGSPRPSSVVSSWTGKVDQQEPEERENDNARLLTSLHEAASSLAYSSHSRYRVTSTQPEQQGIPLSSHDGRHMVWNDDSEEEDEDEDDYYEDRDIRKKRQQDQWYSQTKAPLEDQMEAFWMEQKEQLDEEQPNQQQQLGWMNYLMPPYPPNFAVPLPFASDSGVVESWDSYQMGTTSSTLSRWKQDELLERLRHVLEDCDAIQGVTIAMQGHGIYSGLTTTLLHELQEECKTAGRLVLQITDPTKAAASAAAATGDSWQPAHVNRLRRNIENGLVLHDLSVHAHAVLPMSLSSIQRQQQDSVFMKSAHLAMALESATLAYRVNEHSQQSKIGLTGYYGGSGIANAGYPTANKLSFGEYLACLQPSSEYTMLELDTRTTATDNPADLPTAFVQGTSIERDHRVKANAQLHRPQDTVPGAWLQSEQILTSTAPGSQTSSRGQHCHFALTTSMRPSNIEWNEYLTCAMEGMVVRYRPQVSMGLVMEESITQLTQGGYGAGSYWKTLLLGDSNPPVVSVLSNSTRSYQYLHAIASNMKESLAPRFRGFHSRDTVKDILPDPADCTEAMSACFELRDVYEPPDGGEDEEGTYFAGDAI